VSTYVLSDLHGRYDLFRAILKKIKFSDDDVLYILGDVSDRGPDGIRIYLFIMGQPNIILLAGNHEILFLKACEKASEAVSGRNFFLSEEWLTWQYNGGETTWEEFTLLHAEEQREIIGYIRNACLVIPDLKVNGRDFYLCHSTHLDRFARHPVFLSDAPETEISHVVWDRDYPQKKDGREQPAAGKYKELYAMYPRKMKMVFGHTPTCYLDGTAPDGRGRIFHGGKGHLIGIDCGCASTDPDLAMLGCLRLEDLAEFYVPGTVRPEK
jgi:serine/threonine protein phosphatase 1